jgi:aminopeptidase N
MAGCSRGRDAATGLVAFPGSGQTARQHLIGLAAGYFRQLESRRRLPLTFHTPPSEFACAESSFRDTADMIAFFEEDIGVAYPWARYAQVCVQDFVAGGMENTTLTILNHHTLFPPETGELRSSQGLVAHELAHQWFGDLVTCKD